MTPQQTATPTGTNINSLTYQEHADLILTTTLPGDIDALELAYNGVIKGHPEMRKALYEAARRNARHRRSLAPDEPLPALESLRITELSMMDILPLLQQTHDTQVVDSIEQWTEARLRKWPDFRKGLFNIARLGIEYRQAAGFPSKN